MNRSIAVALASVLFLIAGSVRAQSFYDLYDEGLAYEAQGKIFQAIAMYESAASGRNGKAAKRLGEIYSAGAPGIPPNPTLAAQWYGRARLMGEDVPPPTAAETEAARTAAQRTAALGSGLHEQAQVLEAQGKAGEAVKSYVRAARSGNGKAALRLCEIYDKGLLGVARDYAEGLKWCNVARVLGEEAPLATRGSMTTAEQTAAEKAAFEAARAAQRAKSDAAAGLYDRAHGLEREGKGPEAVKLYVEAAQSGNGRSAYRLGEIYEKGIAGVQPNAADSKKWFNAARVLGYPPAVMCRLALCEQALALDVEGRGAEAVPLYIRAARSGDGQAAKRLGEVYDKGLGGVPRDYAESLKWYNAARVLGEEVPMAKSR